MSMYKAFKTDADLEKNGIPVTYTDDGEPSFRVTLARAGGANKKYHKVMKRISQGHRRAIETNTITPGAAREIQKQGFIESVILNWECYKEGQWIQGIFDENDDIIPFNAENVAKTLDNLGDLFEDLVAQANNFSLFQRQEMETEEKN